MLCYRDMTFCPLWESCAHGDGCPHAPTPVVRRRAEECGLPVSEYAGPPECYEKER